jgi:hypothetical protein
MYSVRPAAPKRRFSRRFVAVSTGLLFGAAGLLTAPAFAAPHSRWAPANCIVDAHSNLLVVNANQVRLQNVDINMQSAYFGNTYALSSSDWKNSGTIDNAGKISVIVPSSDSTAVVPFSTTSGVSMSITVTNGGNTVCTQTFSMGDPEGTTTTSSTSTTLVGGSTTTSTSTSTTLPATTTTTVPATTTTMAHTTTTDIGVPAGEVSSTSKTTVTNPPTTVAPVKTSTNVNPVSASVAVDSSDDQSDTSDDQSDDSSDVSSDDSSDDSIDSTDSRISTGTSTSDDSTTADSSLAFTGANVTPMIGLGLGLLGLGGAMLWVAMWRRDHVIFED